MAKENADDSNKNKLVLNLGEEDSALIVRSNGEIELVSRELHENEDDGNIVYKPIEIIGIEVSD